MATASLTPQSWAQQEQADQQKTSNFADIYRRWQQAQEPEQKIALGEEAIAQEAALTSWPLSEQRDRVKGELWFGLGSAYVVRASGIRANNLDKAVAYLEAALKVFTREADPPNWAVIENNLGNAYQARVRGERADNQERAIAHFEAALTVLTREAYPLQWAQLQNNLGVVYWNRVRGERAENLEDAIMHLEAALTVFTRETHPQLWAAAHNNLGSAYQVRVLGERVDNREKAIAHVEAALTVFARDATQREWAQAENNLAAIYLGRIRGERADNQEKAIAHLASALTVFTREAFPQEWATVQRGIGNAYAERVRGDRASNGETSIAAYEAALSVLTREASPLEHLRTARRLSHILLQTGQWNKAGLALAGAREAFLLLFGQGLEDAESRALIAEAGPLFAEAAFAAVQRGEKEAAIQLASEGRARLLAVAMKLQMLELPAGEREHLDTLRAAIRVAQQAVDTTHGTQRSEALARLMSLRQELLGLVGRGRGAGTTSALAQAHAIISAGSAIAMPVVTEFGAKLVVITKRAADGDAIAVIDLPELTTDRLSRLLIGPGDGPPAGWIGAYFVNYLDGEERDKRWSEWIGAIDKLGPELWDLFGARLNAALKKAGIKPGARLVWLPSGWLGVLPLGLAQDPSSKRRIADDYEIVYAPSLEALTAAQDRIVKATGSPTLAAVINPTGDLPGTEKEGAFVASHFASDARTVLERDAATSDAVLAALKGKTHWHFASHGTFSWKDARQSALVMHGPAMLSVGRLLETSGLGRPRLVVLSACETGLSDITTSPDEFIGLPGTFTALGAAGVLGTLWPVSDAATALLIARFYELHMSEHLPPPTALHRAQAWLRKATSKDLDSYARVAVAQGRLQRRHLSEIEAALSPEGPNRARNGALVEWIIRKGPASGAKSRRSARPYAHPYFWGGFIYTGL
jgi:CHAT domain-containing protein/tetratricopeptide (TPR) repeat protein